MEGFFGILKRGMFYGFEKQFKNLTELEDASETTLSITIRKESKSN